MAGLLGYCFDSTHPRHQRLPENKNKGIQSGNRMRETQKQHQIQPEGTPTHAQWGLSSRNPISWSTSEEPRTKNPIVACMESDRDSMSWME